MASRESSWTLGYNRLGTWLLSVGEPIDKACRVMAIVGGFSAVALVLLITTGVLTRYVFFYSLQWGDEVATYLLAVAIFFGAGFTLLDGGHIRVTMVVDRLSERLRICLDIACLLIALVYGGLLIWGGACRAYDAILWDYRGLQISLAWFPIWIVYAVLPIGVFCHCLACLLVMARAINKLRLLLHGRN